MSSTLVLFKVESDFFEGLTWMPSGGSFGFVMETLAVYIEDKDKELSEILNDMSFGDFGDFASLSHERLQMIYDTLQDIIQDLCQDPIEKAGIEIFGQLKAVMSTHPNIQADTDECSIRINSHTTWSGKRWVYEYLLTWVILMIDELEDVNKNWLFSNHVDWRTLSDKLYENVFEAMFWCHKWYKTPLIRNVKGKVFLQTMSETVLSIYPALKQDTRSEAIIKSNNWENV